MQSNNKYEEFRLPRDGNGKSDLVFTGEQVAFISSDPDELGDRWTELLLYVTAGGKLISQSIGKSVLPHEANISSCEVYEDLESACDFFKVKGRVTWLSRQMFEEIGKAYPGFDKVERVG